MAEYDHYTRRYREETRIGSIHIDRHQRATEASSRDCPGGKTKGEQQERAEERLKNISENRLTEEKDNKKQKILYIAGQSVNKKLGELKAIFIELNQILFFQ